LQARAVGGTFTTYSKLELLISLNIFSETTCDPQSLGGGRRQSRHLYAIFFWPYIGCPIDMATFIYNKTSLIIIDIYILKRCQTYLCDLIKGVVY
jgi:hypothetical protein